MKKIIFILTLIYSIVLLYFLQKPTTIQEPNGEIIEVFEEVTETEEEQIVEELENRIYCDFNVSFYDACMECCGKTNGVCANGYEGIAWVTCAAPYNIPFGSTVHIEGLGDFIVYDRGGAITQDGDVYCIDIYVNTHEEALQCGRQYKTGYIDLKVD